MHARTILLVSILVGAPTATASTLEPGQAGLFFGPDPNTRSGVVPPFAAFDLYLVARVPPGGLQRWELVGFDLPDQHLAPVSGPSFYDLGPFVAHQLADACSHAEALPGACPADEGSIVVLARQRFLRLSTEAWVCPSGFTCPSFAGPVQVEVEYRGCDAPNVVRRFELLEGGCFALDGRVQSAADSWGAVKALYAESE